jgi:hypothetical protein
MWQMYQRSCLTRHAGAFDCHGRNGPDARRRCARRYHGNQLDLQHCLPEDTPFARRRWFVAVFRGVQATRELVMFMYSGKPDTRSPSGVRRNLPQSLVRTQKEGVLSVKELFLDPST